MASSETAIEENGLGKCVDRENPGQVLAAIEREVAAIERREVAEAMDALEARGEVTDTHREAVEALADGIADALLEAPAETLRAAERHDDPEAAATAIRLFDPEG